MKQQPKKRNDSERPAYKYRYQVAEEVLHQNGTNEDIQRRIMEEFPASRENPTRAQWYRHSFERHGHCRGNHPRQSGVGRPPIPKHEAKGRIVPVRFTAEDIKRIEAVAKSNQQSVSEWIRGTIHAELGA